MNAGKYSWVACYYRQPYISFTRRASWSRFLLRWNWLTLDLPGHFCLLFQRKKLLKLDTTLLLLLFLPPTCPPSQASRTAINPPQPLTPIYVCRVSLHSAELIKWQKTACCYCQPWTCTCTLILYHRSHSQSVPLLTRVARKKVMAVLEWTIKDKDIVCVQCKQTDGVTTASQTI